MLDVLNDLNDGFSFFSIYLLFYTQWQDGSRQEGKQEAEYTQSSADWEEKGEMSAKQMCRGIMVIWSFWDFLGSSINVRRSFKLYSRSVGVCAWRYGTLGRRLQHLRWAHHHVKLTWIWRNTTRR